MSSATARPLFINGRFLTQEKTGVQKFAFEVARELMGPPFHATVLVPKNSQQPEMERELKTEQVGALTGHLWEQMELGYAVKKRGGYLLNLANTGPLNFSPQALVLHDAAFRVNPDWFSKKFSVGYNMLIPRLVAGADLLFTVSQTAASDIERFFDIPQQNIRILHNGVCQSFLNVSRDSATQASSSADPARQMSKTFLSVSSLNPRKNFTRLVRAFREVSDPEARLVLTGAGHRAFADTHLEEEMARDSRIVFKGYVSDRELIELYKTAMAFIYPSLYEGFGLPILEAMHFDCPVAASDIPVFSELFGGAYNAFNPLDEQAITASMNRLLSDAEHRAELSRSGRERSEKYRYALTAKHLGEALLPRLNSDA